MKRTILAVVLIMGLVRVATAVSQSVLPTEAQMIAAAITHLPEPLRNGAGVVRLEATNHPQMIRKSTNGMVCITDKSGDEMFDVRCYEQHFIEVVYRAFQLGYSVSGPKVEEEIKAGQLHFE